MKKIPMTEIRQAYERDNPGGHWFSSDTMRFFRTVLPQYGWLAYGSYWFVTSEVNPSGKKAFSVRRLSRGNVQTVGEFHSFARSHDATKRLKEEIREVARLEVGQGG